LPINSQFNQVEGPAIIAVSPTSPVSPSTGLGTGGTAVTITFNETIDPSTLTFGGSNPQVHLTDPNGAAVTITGITDLTPATAGQTHPHTVFQLVFANQMTQGTYVLTVGPLVTDFAGNAMDQNGNGINGETPGDIFTAQFLVTGLRVIGTNPAQAPATSPPGLAAITVQFTLGVDSTSINAPGAVTLTDPNGASVPITITDATLATTNKHDLWTFSFTPQTTLGAYTLVIDKSVQDLGGGQMDQDADALTGDPNDGFAGFFLVANPTGGGGGGGGGGGAGTGGLPPPCPPLTPWVTWVS
jgi:hypothetical protein